MAGLPGPYAAPQGRLLLATVGARICLDVQSEFVVAQRLYAALGFRPAPAVSFNPVPGTRFLGLDL